jgi:hypothetical protein
MLAHIRNSVELFNWGQINIVLLIGVRSTLVVNWESIPY